MSLNSKLAQHSYRAANLCIYDPARNDIHKVFTKFALKNSYTILPQQQNSKLG